MNKGKSMLINNNFDLVEMKQKLFQINQFYILKKTH